MRFALLKAGSGRADAKPAPRTGPWDLQSLASSQATSSMASAASRATLDSEASSEYTLTSTHRDRDGALEDLDSASSSISASTALVRRLKKQYGEILDLEQKLLAEDHAARQARRDSGTRSAWRPGAQNREVVDDSEEDSDKDEAASSASGTVSDTGEGSSVEGGGAAEFRDDQYWIGLAFSHRQLADLYHSFMLQCADTSLPLSLSALPQKYSIPARLWETAFQMYMDRLCSALPPSLLNPAGHGPAVYSHMDDVDTAVLSVLDHMQEYAIYAYIYYGTLLEDIPLSPFRSSWLEQLGDVARYRMQVAEIWHRLVPPPPSGPPVSSSSARSESVAALAAKTASSPRTSTRPTPSGVLQIGKKGKQRAGRVVRDDSEMEDADTPAGDSIGTAALDDWLLDEVETWRNMAREWYFRGLEEASGTGRLHERLAALHTEGSAELDDIKTLYHRCKGITTSHPIDSAESSLPLTLAANKQALRVQADASAIAQFVHLHGLLLEETVTQVEFERHLSRFEDTLASTFAAVQANKGKMKTGKDISRGLGQDSTWIMMAVVNIAAVMEYGSATSVIRRMLADAKEAGKESSRRQREEEKAKARQDKRERERAFQIDDFPELPRATYSRTESAEDDENPSSMASRMADMHIAAAPAPVVVPDAPLRLKLAFKLLFALLQHAIDHPLKPEGADPALCPYIPIILTFFSTVLYIPAVRSLMHAIQTDADCGPMMPWSSLLVLFDSLPDAARPTLTRRPAPTRLLGIPLPEDWAMRGMEWTSRPTNVFGRGYWKGKRGSGYSFREGQTAYAMPESERDALDERYEGPSVTSHAGGPADAGLTAASLAAVDGTALEPGPASRASVSASQRGHRRADVGQGGASITVAEDQARVSDSRETLGQLRWKRIAIAAVWLCEILPESLSIDAADGGRVTAGIRQPIDVHTTPTSEQISVADHHGRSESDDSRSTLHCGNLHPPDEPRRREVGNSGSSVTSAANVVPGYTCILADASTLVEDLDAVMAILERKKWVVVVPLSVVTELDEVSRGRSTRQDSAHDVQSATTALEKIDSLLRGPGGSGAAALLRVQTSRGNYLRDLSIRSEDTSGDAMASTKSREQAFLAAAKVQQDGWLDRRNLLGAASGITAVERSKKVPRTARKLVLLVRDAALRSKARARGYTAVDADEARRLFLR